MGESSGAIIEVSNLNQVGIVVRNIEESIERYQNVFGIGPWNVIGIDASSMSDIIYRGKPVSNGFKVALTTVWANATGIGSTR